MEAYKAEILLTLLCVSNSFAHVINGELIKKDEDLTPINEGPETKLNVRNNLFKTTVHGTINSKETISRKRIANIEEKLRQSLPNKQLKEKTYNRDNVNPITKVSISEDSYKDRGDFRVQIRYSLETFKDDSEKTFDVKETMNEHDGKKEKDPSSSSSMVGTSAIYKGAVIRIDHVRNTDTVTEENINEDGADNATLPPMICWKTCPDCTAQETELRCSLRKFLTVLTRLVIFCVVIPPLIMCMVAVKHAEKAKDTNGTRHNTVGKSEDKKQLLENMTNSHDGCV